MGSKHQLNPTLVFFLNELSWLVFITNNFAFFVFNFVSIISELTDSLFSFSVKKSIERLIFEESKVKRMKILILCLLTARTCLGRVRIQEVKITLGGSRRFSEIGHRGHWWVTLGGIASICFGLHFQQTLQMHTQGCQGCQRTRNFVRNSKIIMARSTIQPNWVK